MRRGDLSLVFDAGGRGLVTRAEGSGVTYGSANASSGLFASLAVARGEPSPLAPIAGDEVRGEVRVERVAGSVTEEGGEATISGTCSFAGIGDAPFSVAVRVPREGPAMSVSAEIALPESARRHFLASFGLALPLDLDFHPTSKMGSEVDREKAAAAILPRAGTPVPEVRWLVAEQDSASVWGPMLWTLAGIRQVTPAAMEVWEAWSPVNPPLVLQAHRVHPGWMAVADGRRVVAAGLGGIERIAPKEILVDAGARVLRVCFHSPRSRPLDLATAPAILSAGPAHVFMEPAGRDDRKAVAYRSPESRPELAEIGEALRDLPPSECNFGRAPLVEAAAPRDVPAYPADPEYSSHEPGRPDEIPIWIDETRGRDIDAFPITRGVPLAQGVLPGTDAADAAGRDPDARGVSDVALLDEEGRPVPCAARALAFWPDRSVKWLLLDFQARLRADAGAKLTLLVGARARRAPMRPDADRAGGGPRSAAMSASAPRTLEVSEAPGRVMVDTGALWMSFRVEDGQLALEGRLDLDGDGRTAGDETIIDWKSAREDGAAGATEGSPESSPETAPREAEALGAPGRGEPSASRSTATPGLSSPGIFGCAFSHVDDPARFPSGVWIDPGRPDPGRAVVRELRVEERSPLRVVVLVRASLRHRRLASTIPAAHRPEDGTPVSLRLHFHAGSPLVRVQHTFLFAGDVRFDYLRELGLLLPLPARARATVRTSVDGAEVDLSGADEAGILQESSDSALAWKAWRARGGSSEGKQGRQPEPGPRGSGKPAVEIPARGRAADGWLDVSGERWGVVVGLRRMREMHPQEIAVDEAGVWTRFYPPRAAPMDLRRYAFKYGDGESTSTGFGSAFGALRTHEALWCFHP
ncbi:MAG: hypothetical protein JXA90_09510, partial [Planctomycetes bacterium]|nr:hypothetical protein [Planctomycetota bacterium]